MSSTVDKDKQKEEAEKQKRKEKKERQKHTEEENLKKIELQQSEKLRLNYVFNQLCELENEKSSDDDSKSKKYLKDINEKAKIGGPGEITVIGDSVVVEQGATVKEGMMVDPDNLVEASKEDKLCQKTSLESFAQEAKASS